MVEVRQKVLKHNDVIARALRQRFADAGVFVVSLVSSPGAGNTTFLEEILRRASYDLGENLRLVLFSVTEGEDKPLKYPTIFNTADVAIITKIDLAAAIEFDELVARVSIQSVRPNMPVFELSARTGNMHMWIDDLYRRFTNFRSSKTKVVLVLT